MAHAEVDVWQRATAYRMALADRVDALGPSDLDAASWCEGWRVRDVIGHLVHLAEGTQRSMVVDIARQGPGPDRALARIGRDIGDRPATELAARLRAAAGGRYHVLGTPRAVILGELLVHSEDALRPLGCSLELRPADAVPVLGIYRRVGRVVFRGAALRGVRLVADDVDWSVGHGDEIVGRATDLLLLLANRRQVVPALAGAGLARLT